MVYLPDYYNVVNLVTKQAKEKGITLQVPKMPALRQVPAGFARLDLEGVNPETGRPMKVAFTGDRAKTMHMVLGARKPSEAEPVTVNIDGRLKARQYHDYETGMLKMKMQFEVVSSEVTPSARRRHQQQEADALCA